MRSTVSCRAKGVPVSGAAALLVILLVVLVAIPLPAYVVGRRRGIRDAWVAFIPFFGATIVLLWSISRSGWMSLIAFIPLVGFFWSIDLVCSDDSGGAWTDTVVGGRVLLPAAARLLPVRVHAR
jgi:hypothetical protein